MNKQDAVKRMQAILAEEAATFERKNNDYAGQGTEDAFANFRLIEHVTKGKITAEDGLIVRMTDKLARIYNLLHQEAAVLDEKGQDTCRDLAVYSNILEMLWDERVDGEIESLEADEVNTGTLGPNGKTFGQQQAENFIKSVTPSPDAWETLSSLIRNLRQGTGA